MVKKKTSKLRLILRFLEQKANLADQKIYTLHLTLNNR